MADPQSDPEITFSASIKRLLEESESLSIEISSRFADVLHQNPQITISAANRALISKRVINVDRYATPHGVPVLISMDIMSLCDRLICYPYIPRYRRRLDDEDLQGRAALITHIHSLTGAEMYSVLERATALMRDVWLLASDYGIAGEQCAASFQRKFRRRFDGALRERHRVVHAHEAPSMRSRMINVVNRARNLPIEVIPSIVDALAEELASSLAVVESKQVGFLELVKQAASAQGQEGRYATEASDALSMVRDHLRLSVKTAAED